MLFLLLGLYPSSLNPVSLVNSYLSGKTQLRYHLLQRVFLGHFPHQELVTKPFFLLTASYTTFHDYYLCLHLFESKDDVIFMSVSPAQAQCLAHCNSHAYHMYTKPWLTQLASPHFTLTIDDTLSLPPDFIGEKIKGQSGSMAAPSPTAGKWQSRDLNPGPAGVHCTLFSPACCRGSAHTNGAVLRTLENEQVSGLCWTRTSEASMLEPRNSSRTQYCINSFPSVGTDAYQTAPTAEGNLLGDQ